MSAGVSPEVDGRAPRERDEPPEPGELPRRTPVDAEIDRRAKRHTRLAPVR